MKITVAVVLLALSGAAPSAEICRDRENRIEPDMRVQEADLTRAEAAEAAQDLSESIREDALDGEKYFGVLNAKKVVEGYLLKRAAERLAHENGDSDPNAVEARERFCTWLTSEGFWHD